MNCSQFQVVLPMASTFTSASAITTKTTTNLPLCYSYSRYSSSSVSFRLSSKSKLRFSTKGSPPSQILFPVVKAQLNEVVVDESSNAAAASKPNSEVAAVGAEDSKPADQPSSRGLAPEESIAQFITQVASLVKLVDSRDIVELQLKQLDCEVTIRKKEAMPQPASPAEFTMIQSPPSLVVPPATPFPPTPAPSTSSPSSVKSVKSSHPPLKCPMSGTFYRSPAPGEPPFVKVGDKVKKGQVLCIIEAMKLMNEIEADQSGTVVDILAEDGKPVSVDTPLFVIEP